MVQEQAAQPQKRKPSARRAREQAKRIGWLTEAQAALGWGIFLVLLALLGAIYLAQTSRIATVGRHVQFLQDDLDTLRRKNAELERDIAEAQSLERLQREAARMGFVPADPEAIEYVLVPDYPVATPSPAPTPTPLPEPSETMRAALWLTFQDEVTGLIRGEAGAP